MKGCVNSRASAPSAGTGRTGVRVFHTTGKSAPLDSSMIYRKSGVSIGLPSLSEYEPRRTGRREFEEVAKVFYTFRAVC